LVSRALDPFLKVHPKLLDHPATEKKTRRSKPVFHTWCSKPGHRLLFFYPFLATKCLHK
jgi:hypothetical protein